MSARRRLHSVATALSRRSKNLVLIGVLLVAAGLAAALIAVSVTGAKDEPAAGAVHGVEATEALLQGIPQNGNVLGKPDAPVTIVEYADYQCPYCARWALDTLPAIVDEYVRPGKVRIVFQGIAILGEDSVTALEATVSAGMQDKLWNVGELLFHNQAAENSGWVTDDLLRDIGASVPGLDVDAMMDGRDSSEVANAIGEAQAGAQAAGVSGTPSFEIGKTGGEMTQLKGAQPIDEFRQVLDGLLQDS
jgi:protein-disulfide isomerase